MSTRAHVILKDDTDTFRFYRHSDGYPECAGEDLKAFVAGYGATPGMRMNAAQSAGWLIVRGHFEYRSPEPADWPNPHPDSTGPSPNGKYYGGMDWKVGAYEPTTAMHGDEEYIYVIDLVKCTLTCRVPTEGYWDKPCLRNTRASRKFKTVKFGGEP